MLEYYINWVLLCWQDAIYRIKMAFDKEFDGVYEKKEQEINRIKDRNKRIRKILDDLELPDVVEDPELGIIEKPERLLVVDDGEVCVYKNFWQNTNETWSF